MRKISSDRKGAMRILETVIAATIILIAFTASTFLVQSSNIRTAQQAENLDSLNYNVITQSLDSGLIERNIENQATPRAAAIRTQLQSMLPLGTFFNLTIAKYEQNKVTSWVNSGTAVVKVNNVDDDSTIFLGSAQVSSTPTIYSSTNGNTYMVTLVLAQAGGK